MSNPIELLETEKMRVMVTGSSGFIGSCLVDYLREKNFDVKTFDIKEGQDIRNYGHVLSFLIEHEPDLIYHTAAQSFLASGERDPFGDVEVNIFGMLKLLKALRETDLNATLLYTSTGAVYGLNKLPHREDMLCQPMCNYGISKLAAEMYLLKEVMTRGLDGKVVRFSSVYGHGRKAGPVNIFCMQALAGGPITVYGSGSQTRDMIHIDDVLRGMEKVAERGKRGHIYNIGIGEEHSVLEVAQLVKKLKPVDIVFRKYEMPPFDLPRSWFDITKARNLGWAPKIDLDLGVQMTFDDMIDSVVHDVETI